MNNDLNSLILSNARETVAKEHGYADWNDLLDIENSISDRVEEAALIAMEELAGFYEWASLLGWEYTGKNEQEGYRVFENGKRQSYCTESELYTRYLKEKKDEEH